MPEPMTHTSKSYNTSVPATGAGSESALGDQHIMSRVRYSSDDNLIKIGTTATLETTGNEGTFHWTAGDGSKSAPVVRVDAKDREWVSPESTPIEGVDYKLLIFNLKREGALAGVFLEVNALVGGPDVEDEPVGIWESEDDGGGDWMRPGKP